VTDLQHIRNFSIIAHIDHGKSTLADRFIQLCGGLSEREMAAQVLDSMDIERERGITIKAQSVTLNYQASDGQNYMLNFIDTPGHVDFAYEVSRSLAACEGALLVVDASQGVEAQSVANCYTAIEQGLEVMPVLNKIDLPAADPQRVMTEIEEIIGIEARTAKCVSAKTGEGVRELLDELVNRIPPPAGDREAPLQALIIDSWFDNYLGVVSLIRVKQGTIRKRQKILIMSGVDKPASRPLPGFKEVKPQVFAGLYPVSTDDYEDLREALSKLRLNDAALFYEPETSQALGFGFRCGFLGMLHMEIIQERLEREYDLNLITTAPTVVFEVEKTSGEVIRIDNPASLPEPNYISEVREPIIEAHILVPQDYVGNVITLCIEKRGEQKNMQYLGSQVSLAYEMPLNEVVLDFFDRLKSVSRGYASLDYEFKRFQPADLVKLDILINSEKVDALSTIVHRAHAESRGRELAEKMKELIPRQMFDVAVQAAIGAKIIARTNVKALRKNVTAKCYGGDVTRKKKLLEKQKAGKRRMKQIGKVEIPQDAFLAVLNVGREK